MYDYATVVKLTGTFLIINSNRDTHYDIHYVISQIYLFFS